MMAALQCRLLGTEGFMNNVISVVMYCISSDVSVINYDNIIKLVCIPLSLCIFIIHVSKFDKAMFFSAVPVLFLLFQKKITLCLGD